MHRPTGVIATLLALFAGLSTLVAAGWTAELDRAVTNAAVTGRTPFFNDLALNVTALGSDTIVILLSLLALGYCVAAGRNRLIYALLSTPLAFLLGSMVKLVVARPRPDVALIALPGSFSFPSGHAVAASAFYLTVALLAATAERRAAPRRLIIGAGVVVAVLVAWSRIYLGVHYLSDVVGGLLLGTAAAIAAREVVRRTDRGVEAKALGGATV